MSSVARIAAGIGNPCFAMRPATMIPARLAAYPMLRSISPTTRTSVRPTAMMAVSADWLTIASRLLVWRKAKFGIASPKINTMMAIAKRVPYFETITRAIRLADLST